MNDKLTELRRAGEAILPDQTFREQFFCCLRVARPRIGRACFPPTCFLLTLAGSNFAGLSVHSAREDLYRLGQRCADDGQVAVMAFDTTEPMPAEDGEHGVFITGSTFDGRTMQAFYRVECDTRERITRARRRYLLSDYSRACSLASPALHEFWDGFLQRNYERHGARRRLH